MRLIVFLAIVSLLSSPVLCCPSHCKVCYNDSCTRCDSGYYERNGYCYKHNGGMSAFSIVCIALGGVLLAAGITSAVVTIIRVRQRRTLVRNARDPFYRAAINTGSISAHRLNTQQVQQVVEGYRYDQEKDSCMICLESQCDTVTMCGHYFHFTCIKAWLDRHAVCPTCRNPDMSSLIVIECSNCKAAKTTINPTERGAAGKVAAIKRTECGNCPVNSAQRERPN